MVSTIKSHAGDTIDVTLQRGGERVTLPVTPATGRDGRGSIGVSLNSNNYIKHTKPGSLPEV